MARRVFINLPVRDLKKSIFFFENLGYKFNDQLTDDAGACMVIGNDVFVMLLKEDYFKTFTKKNIGDTREFSEVLISMDADSKQAIQDIIAKARQLGAYIHTEPQDHGWMYQHSLSDLDGHQWEFIFVDNNLLPE